MRHEPLGVRACSGDKKVIGDVMTTVADNSVQAATTAASEVGKVAQDIEHFFAGRLDEFGLHPRLSWSQMLMIGFSLVILSLAGVMAIMLLWAASSAGTTATLDMGRHERPQPDLVIGVTIVAAAVLLAPVFGCLLSHRKLALKVRGSLEHTTMKIFDLQAGRKYKYKVVTREVTTEDDALERQIEQLRVESGLAGWTEDMFKEHVDSMRGTQKAKLRQLTASRSQVGLARRERAKMELWKVYVTGKHVVGAMNVFFGLFAVVAGLIVVGVGAMGAFLTVGLAHMPKQEDDPIATEWCWQALNMVFVIVGAWKAPQLALLVKVHVAGVFDVQVDDVRSLIVPGVLLTRKEVWLLASLRGANIFFTYLTAFFMWAYLPRCLQENIELHKDCATKPGAGAVIPICMVFGMGTGAAQGAVLGHLIKRARYVTWPDVQATPDQGVLTLSHSLGAPPAPDSCDMRVLDVEEDHPAVAFGGDDPGVPQEELRESAKAEDPLEPYSTRMRL